MNQMNPILTREMYKQIKHYDKTQMEDLLQRVAANGYNAGVSSLNKMIVECIERGINNTKGIGEVRAAALMKNITDEVLALVKEDKKNG